MALMWWGKGLWQICMHHWTVHEKVDFPTFSTRYLARGVYSTTFDPVLRNEVKKFSHVGLQGGGVHSTTFDPELRNERFTLISFMGFPPILSTLQHFKCIFSIENRSKLTFSNGPHVMGKRFMANLHASLYSTWKSRFSKISFRCQHGGGYVPRNGPVHKIWHFSSFTACITIGLSDERPIKQLSLLLHYFPTLKTGPQLICTL